MATLKQIKGTAIQFLAEDPVQYVGTWSSIANANTTHEECGSAGTASASIVFGGQGSPAESPRTKNQTETFDGSSWTEVGDLNTVKKNQAGAGTTTSALSSSGQDPGNTNSPLVEQWNGSAWTEVAEVNTARRQLAGAGASGTAALIFFGFGGSPETFTNACESWNGSAWTEVGDTNTGRVRAGSFGSYTSAIGAGGSPDGSSSTANSESWNGTAWTETSNLNAARKDMSSHGSGASNTDGMVFAGYTTTNLANTETWNGSAWTEVNDLSTAFRNGFGSQQGSSTSATAGLGFSTTYGLQAEEFSFPPSTATIVQEGDMWFNSSSSTLKGYGTAAGIPAGVWSAGGTMNTSREQGADFGSLTAGVAAGGGGPPTDVEEYNGTSWTEVNNIPAGGAAGGATGSQTAGIAFGYINPNSADTTTYNGTTWTEVNNLNTGRNVGGSAGGVQTAALYAGGGSSIANTETWDGTTWTEVNDLNDGRYFLKGGGTTTAAVLAGGYGGSPTTNPAQSEQWNGTSWTEGNNLNSGRAFLTGGGSEYTSVIVFGGGPMPGVSTKTEFWNGTSWSEMNDMATASETSHGTTQGAGVGTYRARTPAGGATEEWTVTAAVSTVTTSQLTFQNKSIYTEYKRYKGDICQKKKETQLLSQKQNLNT